MKRLEKIITWLTQQISVVILVFSALAFVVPDAFSWATRYTSWFLGAAMFGMGLSLSVQDFKVVFKRPRDILIGCLAQYSIMPLAAWGLCTLLKLPPDLAIGVILVGCCPGGTASNVITYIAGGDVSLSVGMTIVSTLLAPVLTPLLTYLLAGAWVQVSLLSMVISVVKVILIPVLAGLVVHRLLGDHLQQITPIVPGISVAAITMIIAGIIASNVEKILSCGMIVMAVVILHNFLGLALGLLLCRMVGTDYDKTTAIAIEVGMQNSGLAVSLAAANFAAAPLATLPGAIFSVWHNISGSVFAALRRRKKQPSGRLCAKTA